MTAAPRDEALSRDFAEANAEALALPPRTRAAVLAARPRGEIITLQDGTPAISIDGAVLGASAEAASQKAFSKLSGSKSLVVIFGIGMGHAAREVRARLHQSANVLVFEPDVRLLRTLFEHGPSDLGDVYITTDVHELEALWSVLTDTPTATLFVTPGYATAFPKERDMIEALIHKMIADTEIVENTRAIRFREWIENITCNLHILESESPATALAGELAGIPAFIVGAGPSLDKNIRELARAKKKGIVIAVDVAGGALDRNGVAPHMIVSLEALNLSREIQKLSFLPEVILAASLSGHSASFDIPAKHVLPFVEAIAPFASVSNFMGTPGVIVGGSVSTVAFSLASAFGCDPIVLVGQDLGYTGGATHAKGTAFDGCTIHVKTTENADRIAPNSANAANPGTPSEHAAFSYNDTIKRVRAESNLGAAPARDPIFQVEGWGGEGKVASTSSFNAFRAWFEVWAAAMVGKVDLVNATEGGSRIVGFREASLASIIDALPDRTVSADDLAARAREKRPALGKKKVARFIREETILATKIERHADALSRAAHLARAAIAGENPAEIVRAFSALTAAEEELQRAALTMPLLSGYVYADAADLKAKTPRAQGVDMRADAAWSVEATSSFAQNVAKAARALKRLLHSGLKAKSHGAGHSGARV